ncbi:hypothetical protein JKF63_03803 [Porcisia hertigi]|uniref:C2 domain-containing protein n=1 Tax=Porcisia hertigi TaxID=2761500 RepID=A0A836L437_9TRYP|nr:hypothetical protein JKF63_03803 [Porcisia hertigi]
MGRIEVTVCAARKLHDVQLVGIPDPFVRLTMGEKKYKTKVVKNSLDPVWDETFRFQIADEMSEQVRLEVWNKCVYSDDLMGYYTLSFGDLTRGIVKDQWYMLERSKTDAELHVRVLALDFGTPPKPEEQWMVTSDIQRDPVKRAIEDGTWRPGQKTAPPTSGPPMPLQPQVRPVPASAVQQPQVSYIQGNTPQTQAVQYVATMPQQIQYVPQPQVQYVLPSQPQYLPPQQPVQYVQQPGYYMPGAPPPPQSGYYMPGPPPPQQPVYYPPPPPQSYAQQPRYQY